MNLRVVKMILDDFETGIDWNSPRIYRVSYWVLMMKHMRIEKWLQNPLVDDEFPFPWGFSH